MQEMQYNVMQHSVMQKKDPNKHGERAIGKKQYSGSLPDRRTLKPVCDTLMGVTKYDHSNQLQIQPNP